MRIRSLVFLSLCLPAFTVVAQTASDQFAPPAPTASVAPAHGNASLGGDATAKPSPFKFKSERKAWEPEPPPPRANDQNAVMGTERPWQNGQPPVSCAQTPHDPACR
ncbi:hypothetical protein [Dyella agri]|uniref:Uncharacterized protein n=1 Tax=Dyella agri TaxID=1926869 RepID=A0ABW8KEM7_9GAMM